MAVVVIDRVRTFNIKKPVSNLPDVLNTMFNPSIAISEAVSQFWKLNPPCEQAELDKVIEHDDYFEVNIKYKELKWAILPMN
jgi:hypothetical protein